uniref:Adenylosuccinate synthetase n=1 Tax=Talaromyces marneffei PM1 TaxID=1077442 RepID=A0A093V2D4_TALMA
MPPHKLTITELIQDVEQVRAMESFMPLMKKQLDSLKRFSDLLAVDRLSIQKNGPKARAHDIMSDLWTYSPELYFLVALAGRYHSNLGSLDSDDYLPRLKEWWSTVNHPQELTDAVGYYWKYLPAQNNTLAYRAPLSKEDLLEFLQTSTGIHSPFVISVPYDGNQMPSIELSRGMVQDLIMFAAENTQKRANST